LNLNLSFQFHRSVHMYSHFHSLTMNWNARVWFLAQARDFLFSTVARSDLGPTQTSVHWIPGTISLGGKGPVHKAEHSHPSSPEVKNGGAIPPSPICLHGMVQISYSAWVIFHITNAENVLFALQYDSLV
jgi:hypothetical protein